MKPFTNECGSRNDFGYIDRVVKEIVLTRPCLKRIDLDEAYEWAEEEGPLKRFSIGLGPAEVFTREGNSSSVYAMAKGVFKNTVNKIKQSDAEMLTEFFSRLRVKKEVRNFGLKCFIFQDNDVLFENLLETLKALKGCVFLSLAGCFLSEEQLVALADTVADMGLSNMVWPEQHISASSMKKIKASFERNKTLVVISDAPAELKEIAKRNRHELLALGNRNRLLNDDEIQRIKDSKDSIRLAITYERDLLLELEKTFEGTFMSPEDCKYMQYDPLMRIFKKPDAKK